MLTKPKTSSNSACALANPCLNFLTPKIYKAEINLSYDLNLIQFYKHVIGRLREGFLNAAPTQKRVRNEDAAIYNGIVNIRARWPGQNYEAALGLAGGSLVLARFFFGSFLFINACPEA